jgi:hypothetical protein
VVRILPPELEEKNAKNKVRKKLMEQRVVTLYKNKLIDGSSEKVNGALF